MREEKKQAIERILEGVAPKVVRSYWESVFTEYFLREDALKVEIAPSKELVIQDLVRFYNDWNEYVESTGNGTTIDPDGDIDPLDSCVVVGLEYCAECHPEDATISQFPVKRLGMYYYVKWLLDGFEKELKTLMRE